MRRIVFERTRSFDRVCAFGHGEALPNKRGTNHKRHNEDHKKHKKEVLCLGLRFVPFVYFSPL